MCKTSEYLRKIMKIVDLESISSSISSEKPADIRRWINAGLTLVQRLRRWISVKLTLIQRLVSAGKWVNIASRRFLHTHGNIATEGSPKPGPCPTLISNDFLVYSTIGSTVHKYPARPGFESSTPRPQAPVDTNKPSASALLVRARVDDILVIPVCLCLSDTVDVSYVRDTPHPSSVSPTWMTTNTSDTKNTRNSHFIKWQLRVFNCAVAR